MKVTVLGTSRSGTDPRTVRLVTSLVSAGHEVVFLSQGSVDAQIAQSVDQVITIDTRWPSGGGRVTGLLRRSNPERLRVSNMRRRAMSVLSSMRPDLVYVSDPELARLVADLGLTIATDRKSRTGIVNGLAGMADSGITLWVRRQPSTPNAGRYRDRRIVLCYHPTDTTPARYLHAALERAGVVVDHRYPNVDLSDVDPETDGVVFVESPYPALDVTGESPVPVVYWVHHGEIHLYQNLRLAQRYQADAVLLAHSWHLAHRFVAPVFRFPFGVPTEMLTDEIPFNDRRLEVSMVAAGFDGTGARYSARRKMAKVLTEEIGSERVLFTGGLPPDEMFAVYADSRSVIDEGGSLHRPITMRVFEATGSGAALVTDPAPGIELLYEPDAEFKTLDAEDPAGALEAGRDLSQIAAAGHARALGVHTYDHRVDELFSILHRLPTLQSRSGDKGGSGVPLSRGTNEESREEGRKSASSPLEGGGRTEEAPGFLAVVERFAEIDTIACADRGAAPFGSSSYVVWSHADVTQRHITVDAVVLTDLSTPSRQLMQQAHRFVFSSGIHASTVATMLTQSGRTFTESTVGDVRVFDFETPGYIVRDER